MDKVDAKQFYYVRHERSKATMVEFRDKATCIYWISMQPDWEQYVLVDGLTEEVLPFTAQR